MEIFKEILSVRKEVTVERGIIPNKIYISKECLEKLKSEFMIYDPKHKKEICLIDDKILGMVIEVKTFNHDVDYVLIQEVEVD